MRDRRDADMIKAVLLRADGYSLSTIARILLLDDDTVSIWMTAYRTADTMQHFLQRQYQPYTGKLTKEQETQVEQYVQEHVVGDSKQIRSFIVNTFNISYSLTGTTTLLRRLGFVYKQTTLIPSKVDPVRQLQCKIAYDVLRVTLEETETILFMDGVHPQHNTSCTKAWIKKGETKEIKSNTGRQRINWNGVYNPVNQDVIMHESDTINADSVLVFLKKIEDRYSDQTKITIILDNARYYRNAKVTEYLKTSRIAFLFLPPYSPNLNLIERLWKFTRKKVINNVYYEKFSMFRNALNDFAVDLPNQRAELKQFIGTKMHLLTPVSPETN